MSAEQRKSWPELHKLILDRAVKPGTRWRHRATGATVEVSEIALLESNLELMVVYDHMGNGWIRPVGEFLAKFELME